MSALEALFPRLDAAWDALEAGDLDGFMDIVREQAHPECEFRSGIGSVVGGGVYTGIDGIHTWFGDLLATTSERSWTDRRYEVADDRAVVFFAVLSFTGAASGAPVSSETGAVFEYEDGRCVRINSFMSHDEAREFARSRVAQA